MDIISSNLQAWWHFWDIFEMKLLRYFWDTFWDTIWQIFMLKHLWTCIQRWIVNAASWNIDYYHAIELDLFFHSSLLTNYFWKSFKNYLAECKKSVKDHISKNTKKSVKVKYKIPTELAYDGSVRTGSMGSQESNEFQ